MQNLNQIRARHVLEFSRNKNDEKAIGQNGGEVIKKIPPVIMNNGLMAALAYSMDPKQKAWKIVFNSIAIHLSSDEVEMIPPDVNSAECLLNYLTSPDTSSSLLREVTSEAYEWLNFARRLVK